LCHCALLRLIAPSTRPFDHCIWSPGPDPGFAKIRCHALPRSPQLGATSSSPPRSTRPPAGPTRTRPGPARPGCGQATASVKAGNRRAFPAQGGERLRYGPGRGGESVRLSPGPYEARGSDPGPPPPDFAGFRTGEFCGGGRRLCPSRARCAAAAAAFFPGSRARFRAGRGGPVGSIPDL
jgi:hypothetical protein